MSSSTVSTKPSRKPVTQSAVEKRLERYRATANGLCPSGHPWKGNDLRNFRNYRYCAACMTEKAERRRTDPATYIGQCKHGHVRTQENTVVTTQAQVVCRDCVAISKKAGVLNISAERIQRVLQLAREGQHASRICGRWMGKEKVIDSVVSQNTLVKLTKLGTPEGQELKALLSRNTFKGRKP